MKAESGGFSLVELLAVLAILFAMAAVGLPRLKAYTVEAHLAGATRIFQGEFREARSIAVKTGAQAAIRFEEKDGRPVFSTYVDGNRNGVLSADIRSGVDRRIAGPLLLHGNAPSVRVGINAGVPAVPPETGLLSTADPIRFGNSNMLSFSPLGTASPGTFYLAGDGIQGAVRVVPGSARVRLLVCRRGGRWVER